MSTTFKQFENKELKVSINVHIDGKQNIWFKGKDVALSLGYTDTDQALRKHIDDEYKRVLNNLSNRPGFQKSIFISEPGLYSLIFGSKLESAKKFQK